MKLLTKKEKAEIERLCHNADMEHARYNFDGGFIHSFFYDCVAGGIIRARSKPKDYVNSFYDYYIDRRCGKGGYSTQREVHNILREIELIADKNKKRCDLCVDRNTELKAREQIKQVNAVRIKHYKDYGKEHGQELKVAVLSEKKLSNKSITQENYVCFFCVQDKLVKGD